MKKILVISHNVFFKSSNMGKTLLSYFCDWESDELAQFYIHSEIPTEKMCSRYYRVTDKQMLKSVFLRRSGTAFGTDDIQDGSKSSRTDTGLTAKLYQKGRKRTPLIYILRNLVWSFGKWNTKKLQKWLDDFDPEAVFFASGDYAFMYKIALEVAQKRNIPLYISCMDDYYLYNSNQDRFLGKVVHKSFMNQVKKTMDYATCIFPICDKMAADYSALFGKPCHVLHTAASIKESLPCEESTERISYIGNLDYRRYEQLITLGCTLKKMGCSGKPKYIDVYTAEKREEVLVLLTHENGINYCGMISAEEVKLVMRSSMLLIHTESFDRKTRKQVAYSVSTKIADSLASGTCLLAYGPGEIASMQYLKANHAAYCITKEEDLENGLIEIISDQKMREEISQNAAVLAMKNHHPEFVSQNLKKTMQLYM